MRLAAIADIHGNALALTAVLKDIESLGVDTVVNLGDHVGGPLEAAKTADILIERAFPSIAGNHDRWVVQRPATELGLSDQQALTELKPDHLKWLGALPKTMVFRDEAFLCHGTPSDDNTYWLERIQSDGSIRSATQAEAELEARGCLFPLILCGHTHIPRAVRLGDGRLIVNPGSVGLPAYDDDVPRPHIMQNGSPEARYAILEKGGDGWSATFRLVPYDHLEMAELARRRGRAEWAQALATGWLA